MEKKYIRTIFTTQERNEFKNMTLEMLNEGISLSKISDHLGISATTVAVLKNELIAEGKITEEIIARKKEQRKEREKKENKRRSIILKGLSDGKSYEKIGKDAERSGARVKQIKEELITEGKITQEEIEEANKKRKEAKQKLKSTVLEMLKQRKTCKEIHLVTGYSYRLILNIKNELVDEGKIVFKRPGKVKIEEVEPIDEITEELKEKELELLFRGLAPETIRKVLNFKASYTVNHVKDILITEGRITKELVKKARNERHDNNKELTFKLLLQGYSQRQIAEKIEYANLGYVQKLIKELIDDGRITKEEIERYKFEQNEREIREYILRMLKLGYTQQEIADKDDTGYLRREKVKWYKNKFVKEGLITEEEIREAKIRIKPLKSKQRKIDNIEPYDEKILLLYNLGFMLKEISQITELNWEYVFARKKILILRKQLTQTKIKNAKRDREKNAEDRRNRINKWVNNVGGQEEEKFDIEIFKMHIEYCKGNFYLGKLEEADINAIVRGMRVAPEYMTMGNINLITTFYTRENKHNLAIKFINDCLLYIDNDENKRKKLVKARDEISINMKKMRNDVSNKKGSQKHNEKKSREEK